MLECNKSKKTNGAGNNAKTQKKKNFFLSSDLLCPKKKNVVKHGSSERESDREKELESSCLCSIRVLCNTSNYILNLLHL